MEEYARQKLQRYNAILMVIEGSVFVVCTSFLDSGTVVAVFTGAKTGGTALAGVAAALVFLGPLLGMVLMGNIINRLRRPARVMTAVGYVTRLMVAPTLIALALRLPDRVQAAVLVTGYGLFYFGDGPVGLIWMDILARTQPVRQRLYIHSISRVFGGAFGLLAALIIRRVYASALSIDAQFLVIFGCATICMLVNAVSLSLIRDVPDRVPSQTAPVPWRVYFAGFVPLFRSNTEARHTIYSKALYHLGFLTLSLNLLFCKAQGNLPENGVGVLVFMPVIGLICGGFLWGNLGKKLGYRYVMLASHAVNVIAAVLTLLALYLSGTGRSVLWLMAAVILLLSANIGSVAGYNQHVISIAREDQRARYLVLISLFTAPFTLGSVAAGLLADAFGFASAFALFALIAPVGFVYTLRSFFGKNYIEPEMR